MLKWMKLKLFVQDKISTSNLQTKQKIHNTMVYNIGTVLHVDQYNVMYLYMHIYLHLCLLH